MNVVKVKHIVMEDSVNYKKLAMFVSMGRCAWKCCHVNGGFDKKICQNDDLRATPDKEIDLVWLCDQYVNNPLVSAMVLGGLDPLDDMDETMKLCKAFRSVTEDTIVIYTGYNEDEVVDKVDQLRIFSTHSDESGTNLVIKFGRYVPGVESRFSPVLGITLASLNQTAKHIKRFV